MQEAVFQSLYGFNESYVADKKVRRRMSSDTVSDTYAKARVRTAATNTFHRLKMVLLFAFFVALMMILLYSNAEMTTQQGEFDRLSAEIVELESEYAYLSFQIESRTSLDKVEEYAVRNLGLIKSEGAKVEYIDLHQENYLEVKQTQLTKWQELLSQNFLSIVEYLNP